MLFNKSQKKYNEIHTLVVAGKIVGAL